MKLPTAGGLSELSVATTVKEAKLDIPEYIDVPEYVSDRTSGYTLMALGWMAWIWLFMPLVSLGLWWFESSLIFDHVLRDHKPYQGMTLLELALLIIVAFLSLLLWASYNWIRFNRIDRRSAPRPVELQEIAYSFDVEKHALLEMVQAKHLILYYDQGGRLEQYDIQGRLMKLSLA
ncbi:poly-beta-1,6-N-acetyl-D-glucosamine biosynthesis protein PgaD [Acinetobacter sp. ASP199]|nr:poly-beta-1,6-N-acetyl-D-glucosamine biosynthesis protein PgaD [Acinetobacter sp. ASP199]